MNVLADESVERQIVARLRQDGYSVLYVAEMEPGITDNLVLRRVNETQSFLITEDKDFGELVFRQGLAHCGVVLVRLAGLPAHAKALMVSQALAAHRTELSNAFSVITPGIVRIRRSGGIDLEET